MCSSKDGSEKGEETDSHPIPTFDIFHLKTTYNFVIKSTYIVELNASFGFYIIIRFQTSKYCI